MISLPFFLLRPPLSHSHYPPSPVVFFGRYGYLQKLGGLVTRCGPWMWVPHLCKVIFLRSRNIQSKYFSFVTRCIYGWSTLHTFLIFWCLDSHFSFPSYCMNMNMRPGGTQGKRKRFKPHISLTQVCNCYPILLWRSLPWSMQYKIMC